jgi:hypothetical protein
MQEKIDRFMNEFDFLSNFHFSKVVYEGVEWPTSEHAYQAMKTLDMNQRLNILEIYMPGDVKRYGRTVTMRADWDDIKLDIMEDIVRCKFQQHPELKERLQLTEDIYIEEGNTWHDTYWGVCNDVGQNHLGKILMKIRKELK